uniref:Nucleoporin Nup54 alpha-helical domain-containing protein n=1 Tax=Plectus sambesii TaxID=2011161 RepID=A0A914WQ14_9BILA
MSTALDMTSTHRTSGGDLGRWPWPDGGVQYRRLGDSKMRVECPRPPHPPAFSFGGTPAASTANNSLFGGLTSTPAASTGGGLFGTSTPTTATSLFGATSQTPTLFGNNTQTTMASTGLFGATSQASTAPLFGANTQTSTANTGLFGSTTQTAGAGTLFGAPAASSAAPAFGGGGSMFGSTATTSAPAFSFAAKPTTAAPPGGGLFGFAQPVQQQNVASAASSFMPANPEALSRSLTGPELFGDERDLVIAKLNQLQAFCGCGKGYVKTGVNPVDYAIDGPFCRFKAIGYNLNQTNQESDGLVALTMRRSADNLNTSQQRQAIVDILFNVMGSKPTLHAHIDSVKPFPENTCELVVFVTETNQQTGAKKRVSAGELAQFFNQATQKQMLQSQLNVDRVIPRVALDDAALKAYLDCPPIGFDPLLWQQARQDNPDPRGLIPWPIRGFAQLRDRQKLQTQEGELQQLYLRELNDRISALAASASNLDARNAQLKANQNILSHRLLKVMTVQLLQQRFAFALDGEEERLQGRLQALNAQMNAPGQLKGRLSELLSMVRCQPQLLTREKDSRTMMFDSRVPANEDRLALNHDIQRYLVRCQEGLETLVNVVERDVSDVKTMISILDQPNRY